MAQKGDFSYDNEDGKLAQDAWLRYLYIGDCKNAYQRTGPCKEMDIVDPDSGITYEIKNEMRCKMEKELSWKKSTGNVAIELYKKAPGELAIDTGINVSLADYWVITIFTLGIFLVLDRLQLLAYTKKHLGRHAIHAAKKDARQKFTFYNLCIPLEILREVAFCAVRKIPNAHNYRRKSAA